MTMMQSVVRKLVDWAYNSPYDGAEANRHRTTRAWWRSRSGSEDKLVGARDRQSLRLEARDLWRNSEIGRAIGDRFALYSIWNGIFPIPTTSSKDWNDEVELWWREVYSPRADYRQVAGVDNVLFQKLTVSNRIYDGDCGYILLDNGQVLPIEAERICTPSKYDADARVVDGVRQSDGGIVIGYYVAQRKADGTVDRDNFEYIPRENFLHCFRPGRMDQLRGIPDLAPCIPKLKDYDETDQNVFWKIKHEATQAFKHKKDSGTMSNGGPRRGSYTLDNGSGKDLQKVEKRDGLEIHHLGLGEDIEAISGVTPHAQYVPYLKHQLQAIASCMGISYEIVMLMFAEGSFSSQRAAIMHNQHAFLEIHNWLIRVRENRLYNWRIAMAIRNKELPPAPVDARGRSEWYKKTWTLPFFDWVDPQAQATADQLRYNMGVQSIKGLAAESGKDRDDVFAEKKSDIAAAIEVAKELNAQGGQDVTWRDIISTGIPGVSTGTQLKMPAPQPANEGATPP